MFPRTLVKENNKRLKVELPELYKRRRFQARELEGLKQQARVIMERLVPGDSGPGMVFVREELDELGRKREEIEKSLSGMDRQIERIERKAIDEDALREGLKQFDECFNRIKPYEQRELMRLVLVRADLGEESIKIGLNHLSDDLALVYDPSKCIPERGFTRALRYQSGGHDGYPRALTIIDVLRITFNTVRDGHRVIMVNS